MCMRANNANCDVTANGPEVGVICTPISLLTRVIKCCQLWAQLTLCWQPHLSLACSNGAALRGAAGQLHG